MGFFGLEILFLNIPNFKMLINLILYIYISRIRHPQQQQMMIIKIHVKFRQHFYHHRRLRRVMEEVESDQILWRIERG